MMLKRLTAGLAVSLCMAGTLFAQKGTLSCEVEDNGVEKIVCTFATPRNSAVKEATFYWQSEKYPQDDRVHDVLLPVAHGSFYDYRYLRGRAQGIWTVTVTWKDRKGGEHEASCRFSLDGVAIVDAKP